MATNILGFKDLDEVCQRVYIALHKRILEDPELSELRRLGPLLDGKRFYQLVCEYCILEDIDITSYRGRDLYCYCMTSEFWDDIPNE